jgi:hypothetical protein
VAIAGHGIDATIGTINAVKKAHVAPADVEHGDPSPASLNAPEPGPSDLATR